MSFNTRKRRPWWRVIEEPGWHAFERLDGLVAKTHNYDGEPFYLYERELLDRHDAKNPYGLPLPFGPLIVDDGYHRHGGREIWKVIPGPACRTGRDAAIAVAFAAGKVAGHHREPEALWTVQATLSTCGGFGGVDFFRDGVKVAEATWAGYYLKDDQGHPQNCPYSDGLVVEVETGICPTLPSADAVPPGPAWSCTRIGPHVYAEIPSEVREWVVQLLGTRRSFGWTAPSLLAG